MKHILFMLAGIIAVLAALGIDAQVVTVVYWGLIAWYWAMQIEG